MKKNTQKLLKIQRWVGGGLSQRCPVLLPPPQTPWKIRLPATCQKSLFEKTWFKCNLLSTIVQLNGTFHKVSEDYKKCFFSSIRSPQSGQTMKFWQNPSSIKHGTMEFQQNLLSISHGTMQKSEECSSVWRKTTKNSQNSHIWSPCWTQISFQPI